MRRLKNWSARRAGGRITITAVEDKINKAVKIVGVDTITKWQGQKHPVATHKDGTQFELV